jgi:hypothetical protein
MPAALTALALASAAAAGGASVAGAGHVPARDEVRWTLSWSPRTDRDVTLLAQPHAPTRQTSRIRRHGADHDWSLQHAFRDLDLPAVGGSAAATNGYVHRLSLAWQQADATRRLELGAGVAVSSNALKNPDQLRGSDLRPLLAASVASVRGTAGTLWLGLRVDDRLGALRVLPVIEHAVDVGAHRIAIGFPDSRWQWRLAPRWQSTLSAGPDGGCWQVRDRALARRSRACSDAWQAAWQLDWQLGRQLARPTASPTTIGLQVGRRFASELDYTLDDGRRVTVDAPAAWFGALHLSLRL